MTAPIRDPFDALDTCGDRLPPETRDGVLALGDAAVPRLLERLRSRGRAAFHAADLLLDLRAGAAIQPLLDAALAHAWLEPLHDLIVLRLAELGVAVIEPVLAALEHEPGPHLGSLGAILCGLGVRDERIFQACKTIFERSRVLGAVCFGEYGDPRAIELIVQAIGELDLDDPATKDDLHVLMGAYGRLYSDDDLPPGVEHRIVPLGGDRMLVSAALRARASTGRNERCPCGSGKKYKKCCLV